MWFLFAGMALSLASSMMQAQAQKRAGKAEYAAAVYENTLAGRRAEALEQEAGQYRAASQRAMIEETRQGELAASRARAVAGASGASVSDPTMVQNIGNINREAEIRALTAKYQGEEAARGAEYQAEFERAEGRGALYRGKLAKDLANQQSQQTLIGGAGKALGMYGRYA